MTRQEIVRQALVHVARACPGGPSDNLTGILVIGILMATVCVIAWLMIR